MQVVADFKTVMQLAIVNVEQFSWFQIPLPPWLRTLRVAAARCF
jgi:hypothetical protein